MAEKRPTPVKTTHYLFYHTRLNPLKVTRNGKDYKFPGHILYGLPLLENMASGR